MRKAKTTTETVLATIKENEKTLVDKVMVELITEEFSPKHKVLRGDLRFSLDISLLPGFYRLALEDGRSYRILVKGVHPRGGKGLAHFLVVPEE
jgi:hypothetical protein